MPKCVLAAAIILTLPTMFAQGSETVDPMFMTYGEYSSLE